MKPNNEELDRGLKLIAKSSMIVFIGVVISKIFTYLYRVVVARYFGPEIYGLFSLALIILNFFIAFSFLGLSEGIVRYISFYRGKKENNKIKYLFRISVKILLVSSVLFSLLLFFTAKFISINIFHDYGLIIFLKVFSIAIPIFVFFGVFISVMRAFEKISWYSFHINILQNMARFIMLVFLIFIGIKANSVSLSYFIAAFITLVSSYLVCRYKIPQIFLRYNLKKESRKKIASEVLSYSWPIMFLSVITSIFYWIDSFIIGYFKNALEVGLYNAAVPIVSILGIVSDLFMQLFFPLITREYSKKNFVLIRELSKQVGKWIFTITLPIFILMVLFPGAIINLLFGQDYLSAQLSLRILSIGAIFSILFVLLNSLLSMIGKSKLILTNIALMSIFNISLNIALVPRYGLIGAAIATMLSGITLNLILLVQVNYYLSIIPLKRKMLKISLVSIIPTILLVLIKQFVPVNIFSLIILGILFFLFYSFTILITGCLDRNDFFILTSLKNKILKNNEHKNAKKN